MTYEQATAALTARGAPFELVQQEIRGVPLRCWKNAPKSLRELVQASRSYGEKTYIVYEGERLSYEQSFRLIAVLAQRLVADYGIEKGDRIALAMRNYPEWVIAFWAAVSVGAVVVPLNAWWTGDELAYGLRDSASRLAFADLERAQRIAPHLAQLAVDAVIVARAPTDELGSFRRFEQLVAEPPVEVALPAVDIDPDDDATIFYTSGTTGQPKGALGTHRNMVTNVTSVAYGRARAAMRKGTPLPAAGEPVPDFAMLLSVPLFHVTGSHSVLAYSTGVGGKLVMMYKWSAEQALELIERERVTQFGGVPAMVFQVLESRDLLKRDTSSVLGVSYGGAPAAPELVRRIKQAFPEASPSNGYGLTETSATAAANSGIDYELRPESVGRVLPICDAKVMGDDGRELAAGDVGELWIKGPNVVKGYWNKPEASAETFTDGWLHTGDIVRMDEQGFIYILDRMKDMLIRGGENIYCVEVENVLYQHPAVIDAAVFGIPHRILGEEVGAIVQVAHGASVTPESLRAHAAQRLAAFKVPARIEIRHEPLPRNPAGKILKRRLKAELGEP
jgi:long-chain acyl-CoA synthetase